MLWLTLMRILENILMNLVVVYSLTNPIIVVFSHAWLAQVGLAYIFPSNVTFLISFIAMESLRVFYVLDVPTSFAQRLHGCTNDQWIGNNYENHYNTHDIFKTFQYIWRYIVTPLNLHMGLQLLLSLKRLGRLLLSLKCLSRLLQFFKQLASL